MRYTELGTTGLQVSRIGFGGIPISRLSRADALKIVRRAIDLGVNYFDTAKIYEDSEEKIGEGVANCRHDVIVATKSMALSKTEMAADIELSLRRMQTDYIDLFQMHNVYTTEQWQQVTSEDGALAALREARQAGKIRHIGITTHSRDLAPQMLRTKEFAAAMLPFSYLEPEAEKVIPICQELKVAFIAMKPLGGGAFSAVVPSIKWILQKGATIAIPGMGSIAELEQNAAIAELDWTVTPEELALMDRLKAALGTTYCRKCGYCLPCSAGIEIWFVLHLPDIVASAGLGSVANGMLEKLDADVASCTECRLCESRCPYHLSIPALLKQSMEEVHALVAKMS